MSDLEKEEFRQIGIDLINEYRVRGGLKPIDWLVIDTPEVSAFIRSIQLHEKTKKELQGVKQELADFKQKVSDMASSYIKHAYTVQEKHLTGYKVTVAFEKHDDAIAWFDQLLFLPGMIIPAPKPDPLREIAEAWGLHNIVAKSWVEYLRAALDKLGFEIREKNDG